MKRSCSRSWIFCDFLYLWWHSDLMSMSFICHNPGCSGLQPNKYKTGCDHIGQAWQECAILKFCSCEIGLWDHISTDPGVWWTSADKVWRYWIWILPQCCSHYCGAYHEIGSPRCIQHQSLFSGNLLLISLYQYNGPFHFYSAHSQPLHVTIYVQLVQALRWAQFGVLPPPSGILSSPILSGTHSYLPVVSLLFVSGGQRICGPGGWCDRRPWGAVECRAERGRREDCSWRVL